MVFKFILAIDGWDISHKISSRGMSLDLTADKSTLVQVMAWCRQATSHYLSQCWPKSLSPYGVPRPQWANSSPPGQKGHHFADDILKCIFMNENFFISIQISLKFVPKGPIDNDTALVWIMAWHPIGNKPLSEPMLTGFTGTYMRHQGEMS